MRDSGKGKESSDMVVLREGQQKSELSAKYNDLYDARVKGDHKRFDDLKTRVAAQLDAFCETEATQHDNPNWIRSVMKGGFFSALGDYKTALKPEMLGWKYANKPIQHWISAFNISDELRRSGNSQEALQWAETALKLDLAQPLGYLNLGLCLAALGRLAEADRIFSKLIEIADFSSASDGLASRLMYEREFDQFNDLPAVKALKFKIASHGGAM